MKQALYAHMNNKRKMKKKTKTKWCSYKPETLQPPWLEEARNKVSPGSLEKMWPNQPLSWAQ
jgi:hypothetical protein